MKTPQSLFARYLTVLLITLFSLSPAWATCGGGGGGGGGGMSGGSSSGTGSAAETYPVPWKVRDAKTPPAKGLVVYWFPASKEEMNKSSLRMSRTLSLYASQCVSMELADGHMPNADKLVGEAKPPLAVIAEPDGTPVSRIENNQGKLKVEAVEKVLDTEVKTRSSALDAQLKDAKAKLDAGDKDAAIKLYQGVAEQKCMFPGKAKSAAKELKKLGVPDVAGLIDSPSFPLPVFAAKQSARIELTMKRGLIEENAGRYVAAEKLYQSAHSMDPADPTPLRYLGELYRHHLGNWEKARTTFGEILNMPADRLSRAVALHGLGKMTIHDGEFLKGLHLMEQSVDEYPLALAYRNLSVYWNSEGDLVKAGEYTQKALSLDPKDPYNLVFAAVFMAASGKREEALKIAQANINLLPASYNLAAIYALNGQRDQALALLKRHFYQFERYHEVRSKEMMEARVDAVFDTLRKDSDFLALTRFADGRLKMPMKGEPATQAGQNQ
ncbi:MAG TPA: tetratricopeptide repeat protein [Pyrinomonadaceae bacterium]|nr:tetratricopeptide repeat protein [Pyrinomonadaceae bacterium]